MMMISQLCSDQYQNPSYLLHACIMISYRVIEERGSTGASQHAQPPMKSDWSAWRPILDYNQQLFNWSICRFFCTQLICLIPS